MARTRSVADQLVSQLVAAGVRHIYGIVGDSLNPVVDAVRRTEGIEWVQVRHEEAGAFAAAASNTAGSLSRSSSTMRSAVFFPTPEILDSDFTSPPATAPRKAVTFMPLRMPSAIFGPTPLTVLMSSRNNPRSAALMKP